MEVVASRGSEFCIANSLPIKRTKMIVIMSTMPIVPIRMSLKGEE